MPRKPLPDYIMVFDVEAVGLYGESFAVGLVVVETKTGMEVDSWFGAVDEDICQGTATDRDWIRKHVVPALAKTVVAQQAFSPKIRHSPLVLRALFWEKWTFWKAKGAMLAAEVPYPVETSFLSTCVKDDTRLRAEDAPYPLLDVASIRLAAGFDPTAAAERHKAEEPPHHPLADARQSARLLLDALFVLSQGKR